MYYRSGTRGRSCIDGRQTLCAFTSLQHFSVLNFVIAAIFKVWRHTINPILSIDAYLLEEQSAKFHSDPIWNNGALGFFE